MLEDQRSITFFNTFPLIISAKKFPDGRGGECSSTASKGLAVDCNRRCSELLLRASVSGCGGEVLSEEARAHCMGRDCVVQQHRWSSSVSE